MAHHVLIFGGTGLIGEHITAAIVDKASQIGQISLFTSENTIWTKADYIDTLKERGVHIVAGDLKSRSDVDEAYKGVDIVVSCVGRQVIDRQVDLIKWADAHRDVKHFFPSEYGTDIEYNAASAHEKPHQHKLKVRAALRDTSDLGWTCVVTGPYGDGNPGLYLSAVKPDWRTIGNFDVANKKAVIVGDGQISLTTMQDTGKFVAASIVHLEKVRNQVIKVNSFTTSPSRIVAEFERQTGQQWEVENVSLDELKAFEQQAWKEGLPVATAATLRRIWAEGGTLYNSRDNAVIDMEKGIDDLESAVARAIKIQTRVE